MYVIEFMNGGIRGKNIHSFLWVFLVCEKKSLIIKFLKRKQKNLKRNLIHPIFSYQRINAFLQNLQANSSSLKKVQNSQILAGTNKEYKCLEK